MVLMQPKTVRSVPRRRLSLAVAAGLALGCCIFQASFGARPLMAQASDRSDHVPEGWFMAGSKPGSYRAGTENGGAHLVSKVPNTGGFGTLMQSIRAENYAGKRVRLRAELRSTDVRDWAGLWMRVDKGDKMVAFDNMQDRAVKGSQPKKTYEVVLDMPADATSISFGTLLSGSGEVWISQVSLEPVGNDVPTTVTPWWITMRASRSRLTAVHGAFL